MGLSEKGDDMKIKAKMNINDLYFGVVMNQISYSSEEERGNIKTYNLFDFSRVKLSVATYVVLSEGMKNNLTSPLHFCFGDVYGRTEYEFIMCPWPYREGEFVEQVGHKIDLFRMYVEPNSELLMDLVNRVTVSSARKYLAEWRKAHKR